MTNQEIFNTVVEHLVKQKAMSVDAAGDCAYRGKNGLKCAVGVLIKDECYDPTIEGKRANSGPVVKALRASGIEASFASMTSNLLMRLQELHDSTPFYDEYGVRTVKDKAMAIANSYDLELDESLFNQ